MFPFSPAFTQVSFQDWGPTRQVGGGGSVVRGGDVGRAKKIIQGVKESPRFFSEMPPNFDRCQNAKFSIVPDFFLISIFLGSLGTSVGEPLLTPIFYPPLRRGVKKKPDSLAFECVVASNFLNDCSCFRISTHHDGTVQRHSLLSLNFMQHLSTCRHYLIYIGYCTVTH